MYICFLKYLTLKLSLEAPNVWQKKFTLRMKQQKLNKQNYGSSTLWLWTCRPRLLDFNLLAKGNTKTPTITSSLRGSSINKRALGLILCSFFVIRNQKATYGILYANLYLWLWNLCASPKHCPQSHVNVCIGESPSTIHIGDSSLCVQISRKLWALPKWWETSHK